MIVHLCLLSMIPSALGSDDSPVTKIFKFKEDLFLKFHPLPTAIGPNGSVEVLMGALESFALRFKKVWRDEIESSLRGGRCTVNKMRRPQFTINDWKYPDRYDVDELPVPGQCYKDENGFVQRIYYEIREMEITCPEDFTYDDLRKDEYDEKVFSGESGDYFLDILNPPGGCDGDVDSVCLFANASSVEYVEGYDACNAELYINRFTDIPVYLKCLKKGYGTETANKIIEALDRYFEMEVSPFLAGAILQQTPESFVYNFASPFDSNRRYSSHGPYYAGGDLVYQIADVDGTQITKFSYGFDVIWYKDRDFDDALLPDAKEVVYQAFKDGDFLRFLKEEYPEYYDDFIQDSDVCDVVVDPDVTFSPTGEPTSQPTEGPACDLGSNDGCLLGQVCGLSCYWKTSEPQCFDDEVVRDCGRYGTGYICLDVDNDGMITLKDHSQGCQYLPPTSSPTKVPTISPVAITSLPTVSPSMRPTESPTLRPTASHPPSEFIEPSVSPSRTPAPSELPTPSPSSRQPTVIPTEASTFGDSSTVGTESTLAPTRARVRPAETVVPTKPPVKSPSTPSPTCPRCIIHPDDTEEDACPLVTDGTCGNGERGDGICPYAGHCCSKWGWCGTTIQHCDSAPAPAPEQGAPQAPTYSIDAGTCGGGDGKLGDGFCPAESLCCSDWGYCGKGENYCFSTRTLIGENEDGDGTCGGGGIGNGSCKDGLCCSRFGFCGEGDLYCTGQNGLEESDGSADEADKILDESPLPTELKPKFGFRCGFTEVDARSNCKPECSHHIQCSDGEECWGVQLNYCHTFEEGEHPICLDYLSADEDSRCGYDEVSARGHCGPKCSSDGECGEGEYCFPTLLNLCECHEETCPEDAADRFARAKALIGPYFVEGDPNNASEGKPRSASPARKLSYASVSLMAIMSLLNVNFS